MSVWKDSDDGRRVIVLATNQIRHRLTIAKHANSDVWDALLDERMLFAFTAPTQDDAEVEVLARFRTWADEMHDAIYYLTREKEWPLLPVRCAWCEYVGHDCIGERYDDNGVRRRSSQGDNVASSVWRGSGETIEYTIDPYRGGQLTFDTNTWYVQGHYGSSGFDCSLFKFVKNEPTAPADPVCDGCIQKRIDAGDLEPIEGHFL